MGLFDKLFGRTKEISNVEPPKNFKFTSSDKLMDEDKFWEIIQVAKDNSNGNFEEEQEQLADQLRKISLDDIILFGNRFRYFRGQANTWELWGAIYIIHGGCSDDSFNDFREWVIGQGKEFYYKTINNPESLVELDTDDIDDLEWEGLGYVYSAIFKEITGLEMEYMFKEKFETTGIEWEEDSDELKNRFPKLSAKYS